MRQFGGYESIIDDCNLEDDLHQMHILTKMTEVDERDTKDICVNGSLGMIGSWK